MGPLATIPPVAPPAVVVQPALVPAAEGPMSSQMEQLMKMMASVQSGQQSIGSKVDTVQSNIDTVQNKVDTVQAGQESLQEAVINVKQRLPTHKRS